MYIFIIRMTHLEVFISTHIVSVLHKLYAADWLIGLYHFYLYCPCLVAHFEIKNYQVFSDSACAHMLGLADLTAGESFKSQHGARYR